MLFAGYWKFCPHGERNSSDVTVVWNWTSRERSTQWHSWYRTYYRSSCSKVSPVKGKSAFPLLYHFLGKCFSVSNFTWIDREVKKGCTYIDYEAHYSNAKIIYTEKLDFSRNFTRVEKLRWGTLGGGKQTLGYWVWSCNNSGMKCCWKQFVNHNT